MSHHLASARHLADFHAFYKSALFNRDGTATLTLLLPQECKDKILDVSNNDGLALNVTLWETEAPDLEALFGAEVQAD